MDKFEVIVLARNDNRWSLMFDADNFAHAEEQAEPYIHEDEQIIQIVKDYVRRENV